MVMRSFRNDQGSGPFLVHFTASKLASLSPYPSGGGEVFFFVSGRHATPRDPRLPARRFRGRFRRAGLFLWEATVTLDALSSMAQAFADMLAAYFNERDCSVDQRTSRLRHSLRQWAEEFGPPQDGSNDDVNTSNAIGE